MADWKLTKASTDVVTARLEELEAEHAKGREALQSLNEQAEQIRNRMAQINTNLLRVDGAIEILREQLNGSGDNGTGE